MPHCSHWCTPPPQMRPLFCVFLPELCNLFSTLLPKQLCSLINTLINTQRSEKRVSSRLKNLPMAFVKSFWILGVLFYSHCTSHIEISHYLQQEDHWDLQCILKSTSYGRNRICNTSVTYVKQSFPAPESVMLIKPARSHVALVENSISVFSLWEMLTDLAELLTLSFCPEYLGVFQETERLRHIKFR